MSPTDDLVLVDVERVRWAVSEISTETGEGATLGEVVDRLYAAGAPLDHNVVRDLMGELAETGELRRVMDPLGGAVLRRGLYVWLLVEADALYRCAACGADDEVVAGLCARCEAAGGRVAQ